MQFFIAGALPNNMSVWGIIDSAVKLYSHLPNLKFHSVTIRNVVMYNMFQLMGIEIAKAPATGTPQKDHNDRCWARNVPLTLSPNDSINISKSFWFLQSVRSYIYYDVTMSWSVSEQRTETTTYPV